MSESHDQSTGAGPPATDSALLAEHLAGLADPTAEGLGQEEHVQWLMGRLVACSVEMLGVQAGLMLLDRKGELRHATSSNEDVAALERLQLRLEDGPCIVAARTARPVMFTLARRQTADGAEGAAHLDSADWPDFGAALDEAGFRFVYSVPMHARGQTVGAMSLFGTDEEGLSWDRRRIAQAMASCASSALLQRRTLDETVLLSEQLRIALRSRIVIEQAKGVLSALGDIDVEAAFTAMRTYARNSNARLHEVAAAVVRREVAARDVLRSVYGGDVPA